MNEAEFKIKKQYHFLPQPRTPEEHPKGWGKELWVTNNDEFCGKILCFNKGAKISCHFHLLKNEVFYINTGVFELRLIDVDNAEIYSRTLFPGTCIDIPRGQPHQLICIEEGQVIEFSTKHQESDSYRVGKGDSQL